MAWADGTEGIGVAARARMLREFSVEAVMAAEIGQYRELGVLGHG